MSMFECARCHEPIAPSKSAKGFCVRCGCARVICADVQEARSLEEWDDDDE